MNRTDKKTVGVMAIAEKAIQLHLHQRHNAVHYIFQIAPRASGGSRSGSLWSNWLGQAP